MDASSNKAAARDTENFPLEALSGDGLSQISSISEVAIPTGAGRSFPFSHQPFPSVDVHYQPFDESRTFPNGYYVYPHVNNRQRNSVPAGQYEPHSQQATPFETPIAQEGNPRNDVNSDLVADRIVYFNASHPVQGVVDWSGSSAPPRIAPPT